MQVLYPIGIYLYLAGIYIARPFLPKARAWVAGRKDWESHLRTVMAPAITAGRKVVWVHCASLGEFEQGRPLIEAIRQKHPSTFILLSFFSPSGYEVRKNYPVADAVCYLPGDTRRNARQFLDITQPSVAIFVKYEFWFHFLQAMRASAIPAVLISARFRLSQVFFRPYGAWFRKQLDTFQYLFVQDEESARILETFGMRGIVCGDTRVDRVMGIAEQKQEFPSIAAFCNGHPTLIAGSTWPPDEQLLALLCQSADFEGWKLIIAPHDIHENRVQQVMRNFPGALRYSQYSADSAPETHVLIIDNIGMLSNVYRYGRIAWVGGAFGKGLHSILEPIAFGLPVLFGPRYHNFREAVELVESGGAQVLHSSKDLQSTWCRWQDASGYQEASEAALQYIERQKGATAAILQSLNLFFA